MSAPSKILMTTDAVGGVWSYAMELCGALPSIQFQLANMGPLPSADQQAEAAALPNVALDAATFPLEWMEEPWPLVERAGEWLMELAAEFQPDVVHLNGYGHAALPWQVPVVVVGHSCVLSWWWAVKQSAPPASWNRYASQVTQGLRACNLVITPSRAMGSALARLYQIPAPVTIYNGRSCPSSFQYDAGEKREPLLLSAGRLWDEAKNIPLLIRATAGLAWPLVLAGDPGSAAGAADAAHVQSAGFCESASMADWFRRAIIYAHPALYEPFGLAPLEAAQAGCVLVLADIPSLREIWGDAAIFVPPDDPAAWHAALARLIDHPQERQQLCARSMLRAKTYSVQRMAKAYLEVYGSLLKPSLAGRPVCV